MPRPSTASLTRTCPGVPKKLPPAPVLARGDLVVYRSSATGVSGLLGLVLTLPTRRADVFRVQDVAGRARRVPRDNIEAWCPGASS